jgi:hypothetical protein
MLGPHVLLGVDPDGLHAVMIAFDEASMSRHMPWLRAQRQ